MISPPKLFSVDLSNFDSNSLSIDKIVKIDRHRLDRELRKQPALYSWWASVYAEVSYRTRVIEEKIEVLESKLFGKYPDAKFQEAKRLISLNPRLRLLKKKLFRWKRAEMILKHLEKALSQRKDVLQTLSANNRKEYFPDI